MESSRRGGYSAANLVISVSERLIRLPRSFASSALKRPNSDSNVKSPSLPSGTSRSR